MLGGGGEEAVTGVKMSFVGISRDWEGGINRLTFVNRLHFITIFPFQLIFLPPFCIINAWCLAAISYAYVRAW